MIKNNLLTQHLKLILGFALLMIINQPSIASDGTSTVTNTEYFQSVDGKIDPETFVGWRVFHHACVGCHGVGAVGSELAPDLTQSIDGIGPGEFRTKVLHRNSLSFSEGDMTSMRNSMFKEIRKQEQRDMGELETMPKWESNPTIKQHIGNIYRYLKARSAGVIGPDMPGIIKE